LELYLFQADTVLKNQQDSGLQQITGWSFLAVIEGLEALKIPGSRVVIYTDSKYVADSVEKGWVFQWESKGFKKKKNPDLWIRFLKIYRKHNVRFVWIKGHANNPENEICDRLAVAAYSKGSLLEDTGYSPEDENNKLLCRSGLFQFIVSEIPL
jgi:hypothetical protein